MQNMWTTGESGRPCGKGKCMESMKRRVGAFCALILLVSAFAGCAKESAPEDAQGGSPDTQSAAPAVAEPAGGVTLADMRKAAEDSGYIVGDDYIAAFMQEVKDGFSVEIVADNSDTIYSVLECGTEEAAILNAQDIDDAGYNIALRNGRFLTCYGVDKKDGTIAGILSALLRGEAVQ